MYPIVHNYKNGVVHRMLTLPDSIFVPVTAFRLSAPEIVWYNSRRIELAAVRANACCVPQETDCASLYDAERMEWHADRYGGPGSGCSGGSGWSAVRNGLQLTGIGRTPLAAPTGNDEQGDGLLSLGDAAAELIWSQILGAVLPHGAVAAYALMLTQSEARGSSPRRALLLRQFALRPEHYLRNPFFRDGQAGGSLCDDAKVRRAAIACLADAFVLQFGDEVARMGGIETINSGLTIVARRYGEQLAASFAKRIDLGVRGPSIMALDGRILDGRNIRHVPRYRRQSGAASCPDPWEQHEPIRATLRELHWHIARYLPEGAKQLLPQDELIREFRRAYGRARELSLSKMTGLPAVFVRRQQPSQRSRLYRCMREIYRRGSEKFTEEAPAPGTSGDCPAVARTGRFDLSAILSNAALAATNELDAALKPHLDDDMLRRDFIAAYVDSRDAYIGSHPVRQRRYARLFLALQACRLNADLSFLGRGDPHDEAPENLNQALRRLEAEPAMAGKLIESIVARGRHVLEDLHPDLGGHHAAAMVDTLERFGPGLAEFTTACLRNAGVAPDQRARIVQRLMTTNKELTV